MPTRNTKVSFGDVQVIMVDSCMSEAEKIAANHTAEDYLQMRVNAQRLAYRFFRDSRTVRDSDSVRGLEKLTGGERNRSKLFKRKQNIIRSIIQLMEMKEGKVVEESIKLTLEAYVSKHQNIALEKALKLAQEDATAAREIHDEVVTKLVCRTKAAPVKKLLYPVGPRDAKVEWKQQSLAATSA